MRSSGALFQDGRRISTLSDATQAGARQGTGRRPRAHTRRAHWPCTRQRKTVQAPLFSALSRRVATAADCPDGWIKKKNAASVWEATTTTAHSEPVVRATGGARLRRKPRDAFSNSAGLPPVRHSWDQGPCSPDMLIATRQFKAQTPIQRYAVPCRNLLYTALFTDKNID